MSGLADGQDESRRATCQCGNVVFETAGAPILVAACYCTDCRKAGQAFEALASAPPVLDADGGTPLVVYRKDRIRCTQGREHLAARKLNSASPTRRVFATCCNSAMFVDFTKGHWLSLYRKRFGAGAPPLQMRLMTAQRRGDVTLDRLVPNYPARPGNFLWKLIAT